MSWYNWCAAYNDPSHPKDAKVQSKNFERTRIGSATEGSPRTKRDVSDSACKEWPSVAILRPLNS